QYELFVKRPGELLKGVLVFLLTQRWGDNPERTLGEPQHKITGQSLMVHGYVRPRQCLGLSGHSEPIRGTGFALLPLRSATPSSAIQQQADDSPQAALWLPCRADPAGGSRYGPGPAPSPLAEGHPARSGWILSRRHRCGITG